MGNNKAKHIIFCNCGGERISSELLSTVRDYIKTLPVTVTSLYDLCGLSAKEDEKLVGLLTFDVDYLVIGCYKRPMNLLLNQNSDVKGKQIDYRHINLIELSQEQVLDQINDFCLDNNNTPAYSDIREDSGWPSWYPIIDYSRCTACGHCADFCLFGVYEKTENNVSVVNPDGCKINCPACARICPASAIIFPKYKNGGAVGGSDEIDEYSEQQRRSQDIESFLGDDIYAAIEKRKVRRKSIIIEEAMKKAVSERDKALEGNF